MKMYDCAKIGNDDYVKYPVDGDGKVVAVDTINNGKKLNFITAANAQARIERALRKASKDDEAVEEEEEEKKVVPEPEPEPDGSDDEEQEPFKPEPPIN